MKTLSFSFAIFVCINNFLFAQEKLPVPSEQQQQEAVQLISNLYKAEYDAARTPIQRSAFAKKLLAVGINSKNDPNSGYTLFRLAKDIGISAGDFETAMLAINEIGNIYEVDILNLKSEAITALGKTVKLPTANQSFCTAQLLIIDEAIAKDRFDLAKKIYHVALNSAKNARSATLLKEVVAKNKEIESIESEYQKVQLALATLEQTPDDPSANLLVGGYTCFVKGNWEDGLLMLALGNDEKLESLAGQELSEVKNELELGNAWWDYSETITGKPQTAAKQRAATWYALALPKADGLSKKMLENRIKEFANQNNKETKSGVRPALLRKKFAPNAVAYNGHYYTVFGPPGYERISWTQAKKLCEDMGGYLACLETDDEQTALAAFKNKEAATKYGKKSLVLWVGGFRAKEGEKFKWINNDTEITDDRFLHSPGTPVIIPSQHDYTTYAIADRLVGRIESGQLSNANTEWVQGFICEWDE